MAASCGSSFCSVNTGWTTESALIGTGSVLDLRFEYIDQDHLRSGSRSVTADEAGEQHHEELETINRNFLLTFSHSFEPPWGVWIVAPLVDRHPAPADDRTRERLFPERVGIDRVRRVAGGAERDS